MPAWSLSPFWQDNLEECAYYETRIEEDETKNQFESKSFLKRASLPVQAGVPAEQAWFFRYEPGDSVWPQQEGWFSATPFPQPRSWLRFYPMHGQERFGDPKTGASYAVRTWLPETGRSGTAAASAAAEEPLGVGLLLADQLPFLLRNLAFTPGKRTTCVVYPLPRRGLSKLSQPLQFELHIEKPETVVFQGEEYPCWLVTLNAGETTVEKFWFNRSYPNVMVRWENMIGETKMLKYVRYTQAMP